MDTGQDTTKLTFAQAVAREQAAKNNSDLTNLAHALEAITLQRQELAQLEREIRNMAVKIEAGALVPVGELKALYNRAKGLGSL